MKKYDYILVGSGLYSGVFAWFAKQKGKKCLVLEKRDHIGGNVYCENTEGIHVHKYGAHIFHTSNKEVWQFVNSLAEFNRYTNSPVANYKGEMYNMPFNMNTFSKMWNISTPAEAKKIIEDHREVMDEIAEFLIEKETITGKEFMEIYNKSLKKDELESVEANVEEDKEKTELSEAETVSEESSLKDAESQDAQKVTEKKDSEQTKQEE